MLYIALWLFNTLCLVTLEKSQYKGKLFIGLLAISLILASTLRGSVGTDTHSYEYIAYEYIHQIGRLTWEPVFGFFFYGLADISQSPVLTIRLISLIIGLIFLSYVFRSSQDELFIFLIYLLPVFYFTYTMNALRVGLGSAFILYAARYLRLEKYPRFIGFGLLAVLSHYSHLLSVCYLYLLNKKIAVKWYFLSFTLLAAMALLLAYFKADYFTEKLALYLSFSTPSPFSGAPKALTCLLLVLAGLTSRAPTNTKIRFALLSLLVTLMAYGLIFISYAGLRFLELTAFLLPLAILNLNHQEKVLTQSSKILITLASVISLLFLYRSFMVEDMSSVSPFLPYQFVF